MKFKFIALIIVVVLTTFTVIQAQNKSEVNSIEVNQMLQRDKKLIVLDVRSADEFKEGHIKGAINIDILESDGYAKIDKLDHKAKYIVHCRTNHRSTTAFDYMKQSGFKNVYQMMDGMKGWSQNKLAVVK